MRLWFWAQSLWNLVFAPRSPFTKYMPRKPPTPTLCPPALPCSTNPSPAREKPWITVRLVCSPIVKLTHETKINNIVASLEELTS